MSDYIPFDIHSEIIKILPVKSLVQFRSVSKQWKAFIDNPQFINNYHINHTNPQHHLFVSYELDYTVTAYTSIVDNNTFPQQKFPLIAPEPLSLLTDIFTFSSVNGLLCFYGDVGSETFKMAVIWNPTIRKSIRIAVIPNVGYMRIIIGFGACPDTSDPKLVKISVAKVPSMWEVEVFTLSTRVWKTVYMGAPSKSWSPLMHFHVFVNGVIYFLANDRYLGREVMSNFIISFNLKNEKFGEVCLPDRLVHSQDVNVTKVNGLLGLLEYYNGDEMPVCGVWARNDDANKLFTKIYTVKVEGKPLLLGRVLAFRNNGEAVMELQDDDSHEESRIEVYEPSSGHNNDVGIKGSTFTFSAGSYMETLLLLDESESVIH